MEDKISFGKPWTGVKAVRESARSWCSDLQHRHSFLVPGATPERIAMSLCSPRAVGEQTLLVPYLEHFASYFSEEWLPEKLILMLMSVEGREAALEVCFKAMR